MKRIESKFVFSPACVVFFSLVIKLPLFFTRNIQEDAFITWRVARNFLEYGVVGFNGQERISASTTHIYVFLTAFFQFIFGEKFIYPILIFSALLFTLGTWWIGKILFPLEIKKRAFFVVLINMIPPALTASLLGMEYGILFFLYGGLLYFAFLNARKWAFLIFPILLLWTRIDTVIFLGIIFLADIFYKKKINFHFILGGILGVLSVFAFNYLYFNEVVNHTITAKQIAYKNLILDKSVKHFVFQLAYYGGFIKKYALISVFIFGLFLAFLIFAIFKISQSKNVLRVQKIVLVAIFVFALLKTFIFVYFKAYFDWYYWLPREFMLLIIIYFVINFLQIKTKILFPVLLIVVSLSYALQWLQSYSIGYMESRQRRQIAADINTFGASKSQSILLEPAGIIPFFTGLYTYDEVGLVNKKVTQEMLKDENFWWINTVKDYRPNYILTFAQAPNLESNYYRLDAKKLNYFESNYRLLKVYDISKVHSDAPSLLRWIYKIRPIGKDYYLYTRIK